MRLLLDTHTFLWFIDDNERLSSTAIGLLESDSSLSLSIASLWEIAIKVSIGKLTLPDQFDRFIPHQLALNDIDVLPIDLSHVISVSALPFHHHDPFDRIIISQALVEHLPVVSIDDFFDQYGVQRLW